MINTLIMLFVLPEQHNSSASQRVQACGVQAFRVGFVLSVALEILFYTRITQVGC
jgi:hypothetical protein